MMPAGVEPTPGDKAVMDEKIGTALHTAEQVHDGQVRHMRCICLLVSAVSISCFRRHVACERTGRACAGYDGYWMCPGGLLFG